MHKKAEESYDQQIAGILNQSVVWGVLVVAGIIGAIWLFLKLLDW